MTYLKLILYITFFTNVIIINSSSTNIDLNTSKMYLNLIVKATDYEFNSIDNRIPIDWTLLLENQTTLNDYDIQIVPANETENIINNWTNFNNWSNYISQQFNDITIQKSYVFQSFQTIFTHSIESICCIIGASHIHNNSIILSYTSTCSKAKLITQYYGDDKKVYIPDLRPRPFGHHYFFGRHITCTKIMKTIHLHNIYEKDCIRPLTNNETQNITLKLISSIRPELHVTANGIAKMLSLPLPYPN